MSLPEDAGLGRLPGGVMWRNNGNGFVYRGNRSDGFSD